MPDQQCAANGCRYLGRDWAVSKGDRTEILCRCERHAAALRARGYAVKLGEGASGTKRRWDMESTHSLEAAANWFRGQSGAMVVLAIRAGDAVLAVDQGVEEKDIPGILHAGLPGAYALLEQYQAAEREKRVRQQIRSGVNPEATHV